MQSRVVTGLSTTHNTLRRYLYIMELIVLLCRKGTAQEETSAQVLYKHKALITLEHHYLCSCLPEAQNVRNLSLGAICTFIMVTGLSRLRISFTMQKGPVRWPKCIRTKEASNSLSNSFIQGNPLHFMEPKDSLPNSQQPATCPCPESDQSFHIL
jgi:hypothetical protein